MTKKRTILSKLTRSVRERAEAALRVTRAGIAGKSAEEIELLVHELQVHQIELEMQNEELRRAQAELAQSHDRFNHLYDFAPVGYLTLDADGTVLAANLTLATMLGVERGNLVVGKFSRYITHDAQDTLYLHLRAMLGSDVKQACELALRRADGTSFAARMETIGIRDGVSGDCHYRSAISDISERERVEAALRVSEPEFRSLAEAVPQIVWATRPDGWNIYFNQKWVDYTGLTLEESYGHGWNTPFHPDDKQRAWEAWRRVTQHNETYSLECRLRRADGVYRWWLIRGVPMRSANGEIHKWFGTCTDIEDLKQAEAALRESEERFRVTFDNAAVGIAHVAPDGRWLRVNDKLCEIVGYGRDQLLAKTFQEISHPDDIAANQALLKRALAGEIHSYAIEKRYIRQDGSTVWVSLTTSLIREAQTQAPLYFISVVENISKRKRAEEQLRRLTEDLELQVAARTAELMDSREQLRGLAERLHKLQEEERAQLARELHDEFGAAFTALKVDLHWIMARLPEGVNGIEDKARVMADLIDNAVESVRRTASLLRPRLLDDFGLVAAIEWQIEDFQRRTGIRCVTSMPEEVKLAHGIATALFRILQETLTNVARHAKATKVHVGLQIDEGKVLLDVQDDGVGFDAAAAIYERSLGLFGMQERVYAFGGQVRFESRPLHGATVIVEIPMGRKV